MIIHFFKSELLLLFSILSYLVSSAYIGHFHHYSWYEVRPIFLLFMLFVTMKGVEKNGLLQWITGKIDKGNIVAFKMVILAFLFSFIMTIDVSLVVLLPIVFSIKSTSKIPLAVLVALTVHLGAALTPFGTPQNLFIYNLYSINLLDFIYTIAPFSLVLFLPLIITSFLLKQFPKNQHSHVRKRKLKVSFYPTFLYIGLFFIVVGAVLHLLNPWFVLILLIPILLYDRESLKIDYILLFIFLLFLGISHNMKEILMINSLPSHHIFFFSALLSQLISNVPTTLLLSPFTSDWKSLLWGTNVGGFGTIIAAMANLIAYRLVKKHTSKDEMQRYIKYFTLSGIGLLLIGIVSFFILQKSFIFA